MNATDTKTATAPSHAPTLTVNKFRRFLSAGSMISANYTHTTMVSKEDYHRLGNITIQIESFKEN